jgi:hypothetical protein
MSPGKGNRRSKVVLHIGGNGVYQALSRQTNAVDEIWGEIHTAWLRHCER